MIDAVIPTIPGREGLLSHAVSSLEQRGIRCIVVENSPSCGAGWRLGLELAAADLVLFASDDVEAFGEWWGMDEAVARARSGNVVCPVIFWPDGTLQGAGGLGRDLEDGAVAYNCIFPLADRRTFELIAPWPETNHYCDGWITEHAQRTGRGPIVTHGMGLVHKIISPMSTMEYVRYRRWRRRRLPGRPSQLPGALPVVDSVDFAQLYSRRATQRVRVALGIRTRLQRALHRKDVRD
jgi:hypothetical protein